MGIKQKVTVINAEGVLNSILGGGRVFVDFLDGHFSVTLTPKEAMKFAKQLNKAITEVQGKDKGVVNE